MRVIQEFKVNTGERKIGKNLAAKLPAFILLQLEALTDARELRSFLCQQVGLHSQTGSHLITKEKLSLSDGMGLMRILDSENPCFSVEVKKRGCFTSYFITASD